MSDDRTSARRVWGLPDDCERGSLPFLMLVMVLGAALGAVLLTTVLQQTRTTRFSESRVQSLDSAQAGIEWGLARIRSSVKGDDLTKGDPAKLPCGGTTWQNIKPDADAGNKGNQAAFSVKVTYFRDNPEPMSKVQRDANAMSCTSAAGPITRVGTSSRIPRFALLESTAVPAGTGVNRSRGRTVETTYVFQTNDVNISGGQIAVYTSSDNRYCMHADYATNPELAEGRQVLLRACSTSNPPVEQQVFSYRADLSIELVSSTTGGRTGLCLDTSSSPAVHNAQQTIVLKRCGVPDYSPAQPDRVSVCPVGVSSGNGRQCGKSPWNQRWSVDDAAHLRGSLAIENTGTDNFCIEAPSQTEGVGLTLKGCAGTVTDTKQTWVPEPTAGAGAAGAGNSQLVNFAEFATCIDVTGGNLLAQYMILYTCKQNPNPNSVLWNQKFTPSPALGQGPTTTTLTTGPAGNVYCLVSPGTEGGTPTLKLCANAAAAEKQWSVSQRYQSNASGALELSYADRYTIKDSAGRCLDLGRALAKHDSRYYRLVTAACDGSTGQKWNADPSNLKATLQNTRERAVTSGS